MSQAPARYGRQRLQNYINLLVEDSFVNQRALGKQLQRLDVLFSLPSMGEKLWNIYRLQNSGRVNRTKDLDVVLKYLETLVRDRLKGTHPTRELESKDDFARPVSIL